MKHSFFQEKIFSNILTLATGSSIAQAIPIATSVILTRLYKPEDYGQLAVYTSLVILVSSVATGQYEMAIVLANSDKDAISLVSISVILAILVTLTTFLVILFFQRAISSSFSLLTDNYLLYLMPASILVGCLTRTLGYLFNRHKKYKDLAVFTLLQAVSISILNISFGCLDLASKGLILSFFLSQLITLSYSISRAINLFKNFSKCINLKIILMNLKRYKNFLIFNTPQVLLDRLTNNASIFFIKIYYGELTLGLYSFSQKFINIPLGLISTPISQVFYQECTEIHKKQKSVWELSKSVLLGLIFLVPIVVILMIYAPQLFTIVFGKSWIEAGMYARIILPWVFANFLSSCISTLPLILDCQKTFFIIGAVYNLLVSFLFYSLPFITNYFKLTLIIISIFGSLYHLCIIIWYRKISLSVNQPPIT